MGRREPRRNFSSSWSDRGVARRTSDAPGATTGARVLGYGTYTTRNLERQPAFNQEDACRPTLARDRARCERREQSHCPRTPWDHGASRRRPTATAAAARAARDELALMGGEAPHAAQIRSGARAPERGRPANDIDRPGAPRRRRAASSSEGGGARSFAAGGSRGSLLGFAARLRCSATGLRYWASLLGFAIDYRPT